MKKILLSLFTVFGIILLSGCSLTTPAEINDNSELNNQISLLQEQMNGLNLEIQELKEQNENLTKENEEIKLNISTQNSGENILITENKELKKGIKDLKEKYLLTQKKIEEYKKTIKELTNKKDTETKKQNTEINEKEIGYIKQVYTENNGNKKLEIDYIQRLTQEECKEKGYSEYDPVVPFCIINHNTKLRTFSISNNIEIIVQTRNHTSDGNFQWNQKIGFNDFYTKYTQHNNDIIPYRITIENNLITKIEEQYLP